MWQLVNAQTEEPVVFGADDWPMMIHGRPKFGSDFCTVLITAGILRVGGQVLMLSARTDAARELTRLLGEKRPDMKTRSLTPAVAARLQSSPLITLTHHDPAWHPPALQQVTDRDWRYVIVMNSERLLTPELWNIVKHGRDLMISGNLEHARVDLDQITWKTRIAFGSRPDGWFQDQTPLPKYVGRMRRNGKESLILARQAGVDAALEVWYYPLLL